MEVRKNLRIIFDSTSSMEDYIDACNADHELRELMNNEEPSELFYGNPLHREIVIHDVTLYQTDRLLDISREHGKLDFEIY